MSASSPTPPSTDSTPAPPAVPNPDPIPSSTPTSTPSPPSTSSTPKPPPEPSTTAPPPTSNPPTSEPTSTTPPPSTPSTAKPSTTLPPPTTPTITVTSKTTISTSGQDPIVVTNISTATQTPNPDPSTTPPVVIAPNPSTTSTATNPTETTGGQNGSSNGGGGDGGGGLQGGGKIAVAVAIPIVGVALIAMAVLFFWKRHRKNKQSAAERRKEVEEYGYNPNKDATGGVGAMGTESPGASEERYEMQDTHTDGGYRGWGSTAARRYTNTAPSTGAGSLSPVAGAYIYEKDAYGNPGQHSPNAQYVASGGLAPSDHNSDTPINRDSYRPSTAESTTMGGEIGPLGVVNGGLQDNGQGGLNRGISNASSNYSAFHSDHSNEHHYTTYGNSMDDYDYAGNRKSIHSPVIQNVEARRHTRIETPTNMHYPQQGNSGIAQNF